MKRLNTSPISGMQELLPLEQAVFSNYKRETGEVYKSHGFLEIETPVIDRTEILLAKAGGETEKQIYKVAKTDENLDEANEALRFDHTVPLARYITEHESDLAFPFRVTQIGRNFRGERAQKGRFREFYQADIDIVGRNELPIYYDADVILTLVEALERLNLNNIIVRVSNRKILSGILEELNLQEVAGDIFLIIDHAEKVPEEKTIEYLNSLNIGSERVETIRTFMAINGDINSVVQKLDELHLTNETFRTGVEELRTVLQLLDSQKLNGKVFADMKIVRGLDYYTGTVFETFLAEHRDIGSICSGGRYDNLAELYTDQKFPGVGGSIGLTRLFYIMNDIGLTKKTRRPLVDFAIIPFDEAQFGFCLDIANKIRAKGFSTDLVYLDKKLGDKLKYASKVAEFGIVVGENEVNTGTLMAKDFETGESKEVSAILSER